MRNITQLALGQKAVISSLSCTGRQRQHMEDLGFIPGTIVRPLHHSPSGDPTAYQVMGAVIALRRSDASRISCKLLCDPEGRPNH